MSRHLAFLLGTALWALSACAPVGPNYRLPEQALVNAPAAQGAFQESGRPEFAPDEGPDAWWRLYDDTQLDALVRQALAANVDLRAATANLALAEAIAQEVEGATEPKAGVDVSVNRGQISAESLALETVLPPANFGDAGVRASYQIDLFGGLRRAIEAANADVEGSRAALDLARVSVAGATVLAYVQACAAGEELTVARHNLALQQEQYDSIVALVARGRGMAVDVPRAKYQLEQLQATLPLYEARRRVALYQLAVLTGHPPAEYPRELETCETLPRLAQPIPVGDGATLLRRRPDVRQAERALAAATARVGVATAALYPTVTLGLSGGYTGMLDHLGQSQTRRWSLGPLISWTVPGAEERARVRQADARAAAALARFDSVVLSALQETESDLTLLARHLDQYEALQRARDQAAEARRQVGAMFRAGRLSFLDDLDAQRTLTNAETALAAAHTQVALDQVRLFLALGGGWQTAAQEKGKGESRASAP